VGASTGILVSDYKFWSKIAEYFVANDGLAQERRPIEYRKNNRTIDKPESRGIRSIFMTKNKAECA
jgi:hypothetical protein